MKIPEMGNSSPFTSLQVADHWESFGSARDNVDIDYSFDTTDFSKWKFS